MKKGSALAMLMCKAIHQQMLKYMGKFSGLQGLRNSEFSRTRVNSDLTLKWAENLPVYGNCVMCDTCPCHKLLKQHISIKLYSSGHCIARGGGGGTKTHN